MIQLLLKTLSFLGILILGIAIPVSVAQTAPPKTTVETPVADGQKTKAGRKQKNKERRGEAQSATPSDQSNSQQPADKPQCRVLSGSETRMPSFQGGDLMAFRVWVSQNMTYPPALFENGIEGRVIVAFVVDGEGSVVDVEIIQSPHDELSASAKQALAASPKWTPGVQNGKIVKMRFVMPLDFKASNGSSAKNSSRR